ncbi:MAG: 2,3-bisphosphoglycerate-independent phosphoglycerate mutase [Candidatus Buchananbacteria bacterium CG10_big_fil_rev_8_21_14_0_10_42_9]|uniref:2,3-bisphosphoglycerate-independent phosphoglycerate mutase n=1 Tax=Candidatus Buchananbacteria bacterium CG10_big_fil_rev_8_21_14_0_10_42_9 TaxID=1974526 RepID=A0A2H0W2F0_9BACT|nr:MAG: 2,3-bisphosphoglycerate-independent phosphoglycerate mutase [Candidatus Buchananbacteria bacterium CG10_big_fil_rev_8_21_14_0_10_42_9]
MAKRNKQIGWPLVWLILDGWGIATPSKANPISFTPTPTIDALWKNYPHAKLGASGKDAGLPPNQAGNSEAGHMNLGAGRIVEQESVVISHAINDGTFFKNLAFLNAVKHVKKNRSTLHLMGLLSNEQSAHADPDHLLALITFARLEGIKDVKLHLFTDGRDSPPFSALKLLEQLLRKLRNGEQIATVMGRVYMDRRKKWNLTETAYNALVIGEGLKAKNCEEAITQSYNRNEPDQFVQPYVLHPRGKPVKRISDNDAVIFFNLRSDRARQLTKPFVQTEFTKKNPGSFTRKKVLKNLYFVAMTDFGPDLDSVATAYPSRDLNKTFPMVMSPYRQVYIGESEKFAHVTYFFNGGYKQSVANEERVEIRSPNVKNYRDAPKMSLAKLTNTILKQIKNADVIVANIANADMIAHTGDVKAAQVAIKSVDAAIKRIFKVIKKAGGTLVITADHGNIEKMFDLKTSEVRTEHTSNPVPLIIVSPKKFKLKGKGVLADVAPTILKILDIKKPKEMTRSGLVK